MTTTNESVRLYAYFGYRDAPGALRWLERAFGFTTTLEFNDGEGGVAHAEMRRGELAIIVFSDNAGCDRPTVKGDTVGHGMYINVESADAVNDIYSTAMTAGARTVWEPAGNEWGYRARVLDREGFEWTIATLTPGLSQDDWR